MAVSGTVCGLRGKRRRVVLGKGPGQDSAGGDERVQQAVGRRGSGSATGTAEAAGRKEGEENGREEEEGRSVDHSVCKCRNERKCVSPKVDSVRVMMTKAPTF